MITNNVIPIGVDEDFDDANVTVFMHFDEISGIGAAWYGTETGFTLNVAKMYTKEDGSTGIEILGHYTGEPGEQIKGFTQDYGMQPPAFPSIH